MSRVVSHPSVSADQHQSSLGGLFFGAIGVVFGDIGTSPLYTMKETFAGPHPLALDELHVLGVLSLIFWAVMCVVSIKYVIIIMRADNKGEGGSLALLALLRRAAAGRPGIVALVSVTLPRQTGPDTVFSVKPYYYGCVISLVSR
jgi:KUP system potassium uptake protein